MILAARHLPIGPMLVSVLSSLAFDLVGLAQVRSRSALSALARGWRDGLRLMPRVRRDRTAAQRAAAARKLVSLRTAISEQRRLERLRA